MTRPAKLHPARQLPDRSAPGLADVRHLPDEELSGAWRKIHLPKDMKEQLLRTAVSGMVLRAAVDFEDLPLHGVLLLTGKPGVGKTTLGRGLADKLARTVPDAGNWAFIELDPHALASSNLGRSQRSVEQLFGELLDEQAGAGPLVVLIDEVEALLTNRGALSMEANPIDVHRAVDAALVGLDRLARRHPDVVIVATSNFSRAIDPALQSRADHVIELPLPDEPSRHTILHDTITAIAEAFPGAKTLLDPNVLDHAARLADGLDGRRLRKAVAAACAHRADAHGDANQVAPDDLLAVLAELKEHQ